ncbi:hypothetical protein L249_4367 [Ophiocordyceps polyrhachis-furcata BCC 54312]|uniref:HNH nuclease domain-containing protein n=1 Tax=Ophiocordyceps polyrhachis-furcata BCC 54312 TaxID=1330021 RepID=A0A367L7I9_9HYPO|nr:hypothetical protein L249_4367 [Ophiocordyceps polyrhachis-furcata BCC 54312]
MTHYDERIELARQVVENIKIEVPDSTRPWNQWRKKPVYYYKKPMRTVKSLIPRPEFRHIIFHALSVAPGFPQSCFRISRESLWGNPGVTDKAWNMICLSPLLHRFWATATFAFKLPALPGGTVPVQLQFRVASPNTPSTFTNCRTTRFLDGVDDENLTTLICFNTTGKQVLSGHIFTALIPTEDVERFFLMINIQWAQCQLAGMIAAAEALQDEGDKDEDDGEADVELDSLMEGLSVSESGSP